MSFIRVDILESKAGTNSSNNGVSVTDFERIYVQVPDGHISLESVKADNGIVLKLVERTFGKTTHKHFVPESIQDKSTSFGGCFVFSIDSRYRRKYGHQPLALHDRVDL